MTPTNCVKCGHPVGTVHMVDGEGIKHPGCTSMPPGQISSPQSMTLEELMVELDKRNFKNHEIHISRDWIGSGTHKLIQDGKVRATWKSRLITIPPLDGITPRGPSEYYDLEFHP